MGFIIMVLLVVITLTCGCATAPLKPTRIYYVPDYVLVVMDARTLYPSRGWCDQTNRILYVKWDDFKDMPRLETYGHEAWHFPEQGGLWHK